VGAVSLWTFQPTYSSVQFLSTCCPSADLLVCLLWSRLAVPSSDRRGTKVLNSDGVSIPQPLPDNINLFEVSHLSYSGDHKLWDTWFEDTVHSTLIPAQFLWSKNSSLFKRNHCPYGNIFAVIYDLQGYYLQKSFVISYASIRVRTRVQSGRILRFIVHDCFHNWVSRQWLQLIFSVRCKVLLVVSVKFRCFWYLTPCSLVGAYWRLFTRDRHWTLGLLWSRGI
jgi:hypothetical protein